MNITPFANAEEFIFPDNRPITQDDRVRDRDAVIGGSSANGAVYGGADTECFTNDGIEEWKSVKSVRVRLGGIMGCAVRGHGRGKHFSESGIWWHVEGIAFIGTRCASLKDVYVKVDRDGHNFVAEAGLDIRMLGEEMETPRDGEGGRVGACKEEGGKLIKEVGI